MGDKDFVFRGRFAGRAFAHRIPPEIATDRGARTSEREPANAEDENGDYGFNESVTTWHPTTVVEGGAARIIRAFRAKSNHFDSVASPYRESLRYNVDGSMPSTSAVRGLLPPSFSSTHMM